MTRPGALCHASAWCRHSAPGHGGGGAGPGPTPGLDAEPGAGHHADTGAGRHDLIGVRILILMDTLDCSKCQFPFDCTQNPICPLQLGRAAKDITSTLETGLQNVAENLEGAFVTLGEPGTTDRTGWVSRVTSCLLSRVMSCAGVSRGQQATPVTATPRLCSSLHPPRPRPPRPLPTESLKGRREKDFLNPGLRYALSSR